MHGAEFSEVLPAAQGGAEWAWSALYERFGAQVFGFLRGRTAADAEDLAQAVWLDAARSIGRFEGDESAFRSWLFTIVRRRLANEFRRQRRHPVEAWAPTTLPAFHTPSAEAEALEALTAHDVAPLIGALLPELQADVILLRVVGDASVEEVADVLGLSPGHVRVLTHRGLRTLARELSKAPVTRGPGAGMSEAP
jgi:RNA polymerase sigma-70 factor (ECF subfamily)